MKMTVPGGRDDIRSWSNRSGSSPLIVSALILGLGTLAAGRLRFGRGLARGLNDAGRRLVHGKG
jgi:hypothetical protein